MTTLDFTDDSSSDADPDWAILAKLVGEIDAGRLSFDDAVKTHPALQTRLREMDKLRRTLALTQESTSLDLPKSLGEFRIDGVVGQGGMGVVYRAYHQRLERVVAVKAIRPARVSQSAIERFRREQTALARLHQTCIVPIYDAGSEASIDYFVMPFIDGATLQEVLAAIRRQPFAGPQLKAESLFTMVQCARNHANGRSISATTVSMNYIDASKEPPSDASPPRTTAYWRSVATVIAEAAEAIEHAHRRKFLHRDLKPSNIMLSADGRLWIIDFGLAAYLSRETDADFDPALGRTDGSATHSAVGTWSYMAPEQFHRVADARSDVWGLGVTLYEMLTLQRAFAHRSTTELQQAIEAESPKHPSEVVLDLSADLAAICWKAMTKEPDARYQSAGEMAEDLRRYLRDEPVAARPRRMMERARRWIVRRKSLAALLATLIIAVPTIIGLQYWVSVKADAELAEQRRQVILRDLDAILHSEKSIGWSDVALKKIDEAGAIRKDATLRDAAVAAFSQADFDRIHLSHDFGASSAAYDPASKRLALGGTDGRRDYPATPAKVWNLNEASPTFGRAKGAGLVAFKPDGTPIQLTADSTGRVSIVQILSGETMRSLLGLEGTPRKGAPRTAISVNAEIAAASFTEENLTLLWNADGRTHRVPIGATALSISRDGTLLAIGDRNGEVSIWSVADGRRLTSHAVSGNTIQTLAFSWTATLRGDRLDGRIAAGSFGVVGIVDLAAGRLQCLFETMEITSRQLEFGPEDATIAADGALFESATGNRHLRVSGMLEVFAFSPDGREIVQATSVGFFSPHIVRYRIKPSRGLTLLHGHNNSAAKIAVSRDGRRLAALSRTWRLGVWNLETGTLLRMLQVPEGPYTDNADIVLTDDGSQVAAASGNVACLWDVASGERIREWKLPKGLSNGMAYRPTGELILARLELASMRDFPMAPFRFPDHPRAVRVRILSATNPIEPTCMIDRFAMHVYGVALSADGERVLIDGDSKDKARSAGLFDARTGNEVASFPLTHTHDYHSARGDATGTLMVFHLESEPKPQVGAIVRSHDGKLLSTHSQGPGLLGPLGRLKIRSIEQSPHPMYGVFDDGGAGLLFRLPAFADDKICFSLDGRFLAFSTKSGAIGVVDLPTVERSLEQLGLHW